MSWADEHRALDVRTNADQPDQVRQALAFGAEGIGLCRTEHMFFDHIDEIREMILADSTHFSATGAGQAAPLPARGLRRHLPGVGGVGPATIRLLDPPLHEFLPHGHREQELLADRLGMQTAEIVSPRRRTARGQSDARPPRLPIGHRLSRDHGHASAGPFSRPPATCRPRGVEVRPEVMIPLVGFQRELADQEKIVRETARTVFEEKGTPSRVPGRHHD